jgi:predicted permease
MANQILSLLSALTQAFSLIFAGFWASKSGYLSADASRGIGQLVGKVALPCLLFRAVATTKLDSVQPVVVATVFIAKIVALTVAATCGYMKHYHEKDSITIAGVFALFVTNSNDLAIGIPLVEAMYPIDQFPNGPNVLYIYVFAVMQNILVAPLYFMLLEYGKAQSSGQKGSVVWKILRALLRNPLVLMAMTGLCYNLTFGNSLPATIDSIFKLAGNAFACGALFTTGMGSVGQSEKLVGKGIAVPLFLSLTKSLLTPIAARYALVPLLKAFTTVDAESSTCFVNFIFLVSAIPTAASTPVICSQFVQSREINGIVAGAAVLNLAIAAPLMICITVVFGIDNDASVDGAMYLLQKVAGAMGICGLVFLLVTFCVVPSWRRYPMRFVLDGKCALQHTE